MRVYDLGVRREYAGPRRVMIRPRRMKLTAMSGVGAMIVVVILVITHKEEISEGEQLKTYCIM
jgi:hypothetical protein